MTVAEVKKELLDAYESTLVTGFCETRLKVAIQQASQWLEHGKMTYEERVDLEANLEVIEDYYCGREPPSDEELLNRLKVALRWYGVDHWRVKACLDQYKDRPNYIAAANNLLREHNGN